VISLLPSAALALMIGGPPAINGPSKEMPPEIASIEIADRRGAELPLDLSFVDQAGQTVRLGDYFDGKHPVVLVMAYYRCETLCSVVLNGLTEGMKGLPLGLGRDYRVVVVSIDPRDSAATAAGKRQSYIEELGKGDPGARGWDFLVGQPGEQGQAGVRRLAETIGFAYRWDERTDQFAHAAGIFLITPKGTLANVMPGIEFRARDLELGLIETSGGKIGSAWKKLVLLCYHWDPNARGYVWGAFRLFKYFGAFVVIALGLFFLYVWRMEKQRRPVRTEQANVRT
jgi:protein SCO1/2